MIKSEKQLIVTDEVLTGRIPVMEAFYTIQGEGYHTGAAAYFIRLAGCDVGCVWCDVKDSWEVSPVQWQSVDSVVAQAVLSPGRMAVITGGEPCLYDLSELTQALHTSGFRIHLETSGVYPLKGNIDWVCVSPKKFKSPDPGMLRLADELKVVIYHPSDFEWAESHAAQTGKSCRLFLQPEYSRSRDVIPLIVEYVKAHPQWGISLQTHKYLGIP